METPFESIETFKLETAYKPQCQCCSTTSNVSARVSSHMSVIFSKLLQCVVMFQKYLKMHIKIGP